MVSPVSPAHSQSEKFPTGFELVPVISGVFQSGWPVGFAQLPDGRFLIIEQNTGFVRVHVSESAAAPVVHTVADITTDGERGLLGIAIDPAWPARPYVYLYYTHVSGFGHLTMWTLTGDLSDPGSTNLVFTNPFDLLTDVPDATGTHNAGTVRFGLDGMLYLSMGEDGSPCAAQDLTILGGKILRLNVSAMPGSGSGPPPKADVTPVDNPFSGPDANARLTWAWGFRNPFRFSIDPLTGDLFVADVGSQILEEIDHVPFPGGAGGNFGWPQREGTIDPGFGLPCGLGNAFVGPVYAYPHDGPLTAVIGGPMYRANAGEHAFPASYDGRVFFTDFYDGWIRCIEQSDGEWVLSAPVPGQPSATDWAQSLSYLSDLQVCTDGALYVAKLVGVIARPTGLYRIQPVGPSEAPRVVARGSGLTCTPNPTRPSVGTLIHWEASSNESWSLRILDAAGRVVRSARGSGDAAWRWNGRGADGRESPAGVYWASVRVGEREVAGKIVLLR